MNRLFTEDLKPEDTQIHITGEDLHHIKNVLRMRLGEPIEVVSGPFVYSCTIQDYDADGALLCVEGYRPSDHESPIEITLYQALAKGDKVDQVVQKAVELGVHQIVPIRTKRCVVQLEGKKAEQRVQKWQRIAEEAAKQSRRDRIPKVGSILDLKQIPVEGILLLPYEEAAEMSLKELLRGLSLPRQGGNIAFVIGPEGGFAPEEVEVLMGKGARVLRLGPRILRTETAGPAFLAILQYELGDMGGC